MGTPAGAILVGEPGGCGLAPADAMDFRLDQAILLLRRTPRVLDDLLRDLPDVWTMGNEGPDTWSPFDVIGHLIHAEETDWIPRARIVLSAGEAQVFEPFDRGAQFSQSRGRSLGDLLDRFARLRAANVATLEGWTLTPADLLKRGTHPALGTVTLGQLLATWTAHDLSHLAQIARVMGRQYQDAVGPWRVYLSILRAPHPPEEPVVSSWFSPTTEKRSSAIQGRGLFAREAIAAGAIVAVKGGAILDRAEYTKVRDAVSPAEIQIDDALYIAPRRAADVEANVLCLNHSCDPNVGVRGQITFVAMRAIPANAELTIDYAMIDGDPTEEMTCACGAPLCRKLVTGNDWQLPELQQRYAGYFSRYLQDRIVAKRSTHPGSE